MFQACICKMSAKTGRAFKKGAAFPHAEVGQIQLRIRRYNAQQYCHVRASGHVADFVFVGEQYAKFQLMSIHRQVYVCGMCPSRYGYCSV